MSLLLGQAHDSLLSIQDVRFPYHFKRGILEDSAGRENGDERNNYEGTTKWT